MDLAGDERINTRSIYNQEKNPRIQKGGYQRIRPEFRSFVDAKLISYIFPEMKQSSIPADGSPTG